MTAIIINFGGQDWQLNALKERLSSKGENVYIVNLNSKELKEVLKKEKEDILNKIDSLSKVYIIDHANPNSTAIASAHYQELADFLSRHISDERVHSPNSKLKFSLIACNAGTGKNTNLQSFAGLFHRYLGQEHKIVSEVSARNQVVMINMETKNQGKFTTSLLEYAIMNIAHDLNVPEVLYDYKDYMHHQQSGKKISLQWDEHGDEWVTDAYIHNYFLKTSNIISLIENSKGEFNSEINDKLKKITSDISNLIADRNNEIFSSVKIIDILLKEIRMIILDLDNEKSKKIDGLIEEIILFSDSSINKDSINPVHSKFNINLLPAEKEKPITKKIKEEIITPSIDILKSLPKTEKEKDLKKSCTNFLQKLSDISARRLRKEEMSKIESNISKFIENILLNLTNDSLKVEEKISLINDMRKLIEEEVLGELKISPEITGAVEGYKDATRFGGLTTLKNLSTFIRTGSEQKANEIQELNERLNAFIKASLDYVRI